MARKFLMGVVVAFLAAVIAPGVQASSREVSNLMTLASDMRCDDLASAINQLGEAPADALMFAGTLHEYGPCVEANWEHATFFYQRAAKSGATSAIPRLIALYAVKLHDPAAALWWAAQRPRLLPKGCLPAADPVSNGAAFLDELRAWPAEQIKACTYHAGVMSRLSVKTMERQIVGVGATVMVDVELNLEMGTIDWFYENEKKPLISSSLLHGAPDFSSQHMGDSFLPFLWLDGCLTLKEFGRPPSIDLRWTRRQTLSVEQRARASRIPILIEVVP